MIFTDDHPPAHVHAFKAGTSAKIGIPAANEKATVVAVWGMRAQDVHDAVRIVEEQRDALMRAWEDIHGK